MFVHNNEVGITDCEPGVKRKVLAYTEEIMMCELHFDKGAKGNRHSHPHHQITYIAEGSFEFTIGNETQVVSQGDSVYMPPDVEHGVTCLKEGKLVDVFSPMRKDFV